MCRACVGGTLFGSGWSSVHSNDAGTPPRFTLQSHQVSPNPTPQFRERNRLFSCSHLPVRCWKPDLGSSCLGTQLSAWVPSPPPLPSFSCFCLFLCPRTLSLSFLPHPGEPSGVTALARTHLTASLRYSTDILSITHANLGSLKLLLLQCFLPQKMALPHLQKLQTWESSLILLFSSPFLCQVFPSNPSHPFPCFVLWHRATDSRRLLPSVPWQPPVSVGSRLEGRKEKNQGTCLLPMHKPQ